MPAFEGYQTMVELIKEKSVAQNFVIEKLPGRHYWHLPFLPLQLTVHSSPNPEEVLENILNQNTACKIIKSQGFFVPNPDKQEPKTNYEYSILDESMKFTEEAQRCIVLILAGLSRENHHLSLCAHLTPRIIACRDDFYRDFGNNVQIFTEQTVDNSRIAVTAGGLFGWFSDSENRFYNLRETYLQMLTTIDHLVWKIAGIPRIMLPPKTDYGLTHVYYETESRKIIILETGQEENPNRKPIIVSDRSPLSSTFRI